MSKIRYAGIASSLWLSRFFLNLAGPSARNILQRHVITGKVMDVELALWYTEQDYWDYAAGLKKEKG
jgi:hypothetical protein